MKLSDFVELTLSEILDGVRRAQAKDGGDNIAAALPKTEKGHIVHSPDFGTFTVIDFDVSVFAEAKGGAKAGIQVLSFEIGAGGQLNNQQTNRVQFSVPLRLPEGDQGKQLEYIEQRRKLAKTMTRRVTGMI